jgi:hypothetical protein
LEHSIQIHRILFLDRPVHTHAGIVDKDINGEAGGGQCIPEIKGGARRTEIPCLASNGDTELSAKVTRDAFQPFAIASDDHDVVSIGCQQTCQLEADAARCPCNQRRLASRASRVRMVGP